MKAHRTNRNRSALRYRLSYLGLLVPLMLVLAAWPARAQVSGISYTISPTGEYSFFESDFLGSEGISGLENGFLYGGELGFGFGQYLEVSGIYLRGDNFGTAFGEDAGDLVDLAPGREADLRRYGGRVRLNLGTYGSDGGGLAPYLTGGAGIIEFDPSGVGESDNIYGTLGAGVAFSAFDRYTLSLGGEVLSYRYNPASTFFTPDELGGGTIGQETVYIPSARAALEIYLGGRRPGTLTDLDRAFQQQFNRGLGGVRIFAEPFYGRLEFASALKGGEGQFVSDQNLAGVNAGVELGPYVGLRGFYWRGASGNELFDEFPGDFQRLALYGGELNVRFGTLGARSFTPYGILGGGYLNVLSDFENGNPGDRYFASLGGGLEVPLSSVFKLQGDVRSLFMSNQEAEDISDPDQVHANLMYSAGIEFSFGGTGGPTPEEIVAERDAAVEESERARIEEISRLRARVDSLEAAQMRERQMRERQMMEQQMARMEEGAEEDTLRRRGRQQVGRVAREQVGQRTAAGQQRAGEQRGAASNLSGQTIALPVPEVGEIYVRVGETSDEVNVETSYAPPTVVSPQAVGNPPARQNVTGPPVRVSYPPARRTSRPVSGTRPDSALTQQGGLTQQEIARIVRETVQGEMRTANVEGRQLSESDISELVRETVREEMEAADVQTAGRDAEVRRLQDQLRRLRRDLRRMEVREERREVDVEGDEIDMGSPGFFGRPLVGVLPYTGGRFGSGPEQFVVGLRGDYRAGPDAPGLRFMPEVALGFGDGTSILVMGNGAVSFARGLAAPLEPYAGAGAGFTSEGGLFDNLGLALNLFAGAEYPVGGRGAAFAEVGTLDFGDYTRLLLGYRLRF